jgi:hypothetical protein
MGLTVAVDLRHHFLEGEFKCRRRYYSLIMCKRASFYGVCLGSACYIVHAPDRD